jgi:hypothetical protein
MDDATDSSGTVCAECVESPWPHGTPYITTVFLQVPAMMGTYALLKKAPLRLPIFAGLWAATITVMRKATCCRCDFYGKECSTLAGKWTAMLYEKDEEHPLTADAFYVDFALIGAIMLFPLPQVKKMGRSYLILYVLAVLAGSAVIRLLACGNCPVAVCPMNPGQKELKRSS